MRTVLVLCLSSLWCVAALQCVAAVESARRVRVPSRTSHLLAIQPRPSHVDASSAAAEVDASSAAAGVDASSAAAQVALELASLEETPLSQPVQLELQVSSPALLLNHMAERYTSTSRILMEFVDNAFDDAEALYEIQSINGETGAETESETSTESETAGYSRPVFIDVSVSRSERTVRIVDNCRGMTPETLARVVMRVGESEKRGASFVNGQFGFGMQVRVWTRPFFSESSRNPSLYIPAAVVKRQSGFGMQSLNT
tara:strand:+ start:698 stop:1468 length:771 start_codon:yes stop_codon:yes gene_type:complete